MVTKKKTLMEDAVLRRAEDGSATLTFYGDWTAENLATRARVTVQPLHKDITSLTICGGEITEIDTSGAWLIISLLRGLHREGVEIQWKGLSHKHERVISLVSMLERHTDPAPTHGWAFEMIKHLGIKAIATGKEVMALVSFFGQFVTTLFNILRSPDKLRVRSIVFHIHDIGIKATPIVMLMAFLIAIVMGYQGANQLKLFGATIFTVNLVAITVLREMGVLITAIMVAGRSSSAFAAQIGVMKMNQEVDALRTIGLDPFEILVIPRIVAIFIALPILTFLADLAGLLGAYFVSASILDMSYLQFMTRLHSAVKMHSFYVGLLKAPFFAVLIGLVGCMQGMQVKTAATELGARTTSAVVQSIFLVILADALFSVLFTIFGI